MKVAGWMCRRLLTFAVAFAFLAALFIALGAKSASFAGEIDSSQPALVESEIVDVFELPSDEPSTDATTVPAHVAEEGEEPQEVGPESSDAPTSEEAPLDCDGPHQVWLISSRAISCCDDPAAAVEKIKYWRYEHGEGWLPASRDEFLATDDPAMPNVFYVHGHRIDQSWAKSGGWDAYRAIVKPTAVPSRFVIWSWPTSPNGHPMREFRIRACESEVHGYYLAWVLDQIQPNVPIHLVGFSYGSRLITSTLHFLGGGAIGVRSLDERVFPERIALRASLIAGALDNDWLLPGRRHGFALSQVDRMFVTVNPLDPVLHWYPVVLHDRSAVALGVTGVAGIRRLGDERIKIEQLNVSNSIRKRHAIALYWDVDQVVGILRGMSDDSLSAEIIQQTGD